MTSPRTPDFTENVQTIDFAKLQFSDGRPAVVGLQGINEALSDIGMRVSTVPIPDEARPILEASRDRATTAEEQARLVSLFHLHRGQLLEQLRLAGREPQMYRGGFLEIAERGAPAYPKVYDVKAMSPEMKKHALHQFSRLHVNMADDGCGVDEVMTVVAGGPFNYFYTLSDGVVVRLTTQKVGAGDKAVRLCYSGLVLHAALMDPPQGLIVAFAHGPKEFDMRFDDPSIAHASLGNLNPWIDYSGAAPKLLAHAAA